MPVGMLVCSFDIIALPLLSPQVIISCTFASSLALTLTFSNISHHDQKSCSPTHVHLSLFSLPSLLSNIKANGINHQEKTKMFACLFIAPLFFSLACFTCACALLLNQPPPPPVFPSFLFGCWEKKTKQKTVSYFALRFVW